MCAHRRGKALRSTRGNDRWSFVHGGELFACSSLSPRVNVFFKRTVRRMPNSLQSSPRPMTTPVPPHRVVHLALTPAWFIGAMVLFASPWALVAWLYLSRGDTTKPVRHVTTSPTVVTDKPGPWGQLEFTRISLAPPV